MAPEAKEPISYLVRNSEVVPEQAGQAAYPISASYGAYGAYGDQVDLRQYWRTLRKHKNWVLVSVPVALIVLMGIRDLLAPQLYTAKATILIKGNAPQMYNSVDSPGGSEGAGLSPQWNVDNKTEYSLLQARSLAERVIVIEGLVANPNFSAGSTDAASHGTGQPGDDDFSDAPLAIQVPPAVVRRYMEDLKITPIEDTQLVEVALTTPNADVRRGWPTRTCGNSSVRELN